MAGGQRRRRAAALGSILTAPALALGFYASLGSPNLPGAPAAHRQAVDPATMGLSDAIARVEAHLAASPNDGAGYEVLAPVYLRAGRAEDAARAFRKPAAMLGESPQRLADLGEAVFMQANGVVTGEARQVFERARALDPASPKARYYLALALEQDGEPEAARAALQAIIEDSPDNAPWLQILRARIARLGGAAPGGSEAATEAGAAPAIQAMVQGLAARLADKGGSPEEWARLIRSYLVLGRREEARTTVQSARAAFPPGSDGRAALDRLAGDLDVGQ